MISRFIRGLFDPHVFYEKISRRAFIQEGAADSAVASLLGLVKWDEENIIQSPDIIVYHPLNVNKYSVVEIDGELADMGNIRDEETLIHYLVRMSTPMKDNEWMDLRRHGFQNGKTLPEMGYPEKVFADGGWCTLFYDALYGWNYWKQAKAKGLLYREKTNTMPEGTRAFLNIYDDRDKNRELSAGDTVRLSLDLSNVNREIYPIGDKITGHGAIMWANFVFKPGEKNDKDDFKDYISNTGALAFDEKTGMWRYEEIMEPLHNALCLAYAWIKTTDKSKFYGLELEFWSHDFQGMKE